MIKFIKLKDYEGFSIFKIVLFEAGSRSTVYTAFYLGRCMYTSPTLQELKNMIRNIEKERLYEKKHDNQHKDTI